MEVILSALPPYLPSLRWMTSQPELSSLGQQSADSSTPLKTRDYTRTLIESNTPGGMVLTVPVSGGSSATKRLSPRQLEVSPHGDWTRIHLGALEAAYGREPYFQHYFPGIAAIISDYPPMLANLNQALLAEMLTAMNFEGNIEDMKALRTSHRERYDDIRKRLEHKIDPAHSAAEALFRLGPDAIFLL